MGEGPLAGVRVLELAGLGPVPFTGMVLADLGAEVLRLERPTGRSIRLVDDRFDIVGRGRSSAAVDLKAEGAAELVASLASKADIFVEGFRPGVCERLGIGPDRLQAANPALVYARITGWGQDGPRARLGGHDINYIAVTGALAAIGEKGRRPMPPLNLVGDFGGGGMLALTGILAALVSARSTGRGQVVDVAMVDGVATLLATAHGYRSAGATSDERESNFMDGGSPHYRTYECADGGYVAVGAVEPVFFGNLVEALGVDVSVDEQLDRSRWPHITAELERAFKERTRDEWAAVFTDVDACVSPVLTLAEAATDPQVAARDTLVRRDGVTQPAAAPRFSATPGSVGRPPRRAGADTREALSQWGVPADRLDGLLASGAVVQAEA
ncbi:CaiB/BaiF CoA-transferase family protein [Intrasporangium mesophilum]